MTLWSHFQRRFRRLLLNLVCRSELLTLIIAAQSDIPVVLGGRKTRALSQSPLLHAEQPGPNRDSSSEPWGY